MKGGCIKINKMGNENKPAVDSSWGLVYRLNALWNEADAQSLLTPDYYGGWERTLDAIYRNLCYDEPLQIKKDKHGRVLEVKQTNEDLQVFGIVSTKVAKARKFYFETGRSQKGKKIFFQAMHLKDVTLRKMMMKKGLYLRQYDDTENKEMYGKKSSKKLY